MYVRLVYMSHGCVEQGNPLVEQHTTSYQWLKMMIRVATVLLILLLNGGIRTVCRMFSFAVHVVTATDHQHRPGSSSVYYLRIQDIVQNIGLRMLSGFLGCSFGLVFGPCTLLD